MDYNKMPTWPIPQESTVQIQSDANSCQNFDRSCVNKQQQDRSVVCQPFDLVACYSVR